MKDENYYTVHGWMINQLRLKGTEKDIYAIVYGFTQDGKTEFRGGLDYLQSCTGISESNIKTAINKLVKRGLLIKTVYAGKTNGLKAVAPDIHKRVKSRKKTSEKHTASYDIEAFKKSALEDDLHYEKKS